MPGDSEAALAQASGDDFPIVIAAMPATVTQRRAAAGVVVLLLLTALLIAPFAHLQIGRIDNFIPVLQTVLSVADLLTATLLITQFVIQPQTALLVLASGYICSGSFAFLQTLAFPGGYGPDGVIGDGRNSAAWFFVLWHTTFLSAVLVYALSKDFGRVSGPDRGSSGARIAIAVTCAFVAIAGLSWMVTAGVGYLPEFYSQNITLQTRFGNQINLVLCSIAIAALGILFVRKRTVLDLWLMVTLLAWVPNFLVAAVASSVRFSVGWYAARGFALVASCMLLSVLLTEMTFLYSRLASALTLQRRERGNRMMSVEAATAAMAHELRTPLGAILLNADAAKSQLHAQPPNLQELGAILEDIATTCQHAGELISSIRTLSIRTPIDRRAMVRMEDIARQVLKLSQHDLQINEISVATEFREGLPPIHADPTQLQQVIINLVKNAIEAMHAVAPEARLLTLTTSVEGNTIALLSVQDSGTGAPVDDRERIFNPFFTTKPAGMGLGLAICRTVVENHGGRLKLVKSDSHGSIFQIALPFAA